jgi:hypothetical protein
LFTQPPDIASKDREKAQAQASGQEPLSIGIDVLEPKLLASVWNGDEAGCEEFTAALSAEKGGEPKALRSRYTIRGGSFACCGDDYSLLLAETVHRSACL